MNILLTGSGGFIGGNLKEYLKDWEHFDTEDDCSSYDEETRKKLSEEEIRYYELEEIGWSKNLKKLLTNQDVCVTI